MYENMYRSGVFVIDPSVHLGISNVNKYKFYIKIALNVSTFVIPCLINRVIK